MTRRRPPACARIVALAAAVAVVPLLSRAQTTTPAASPATTQATTLPAATRPARELTGVQARNGRLVVNFQDVSINTVLDELSTTAGFIVVKEVPVEGRVTLVSKQPITAEEAVPLLSTVLKNAGYAAIQQDRVLKIVRAEDARRLNIPVYSGNDPEKIANTDELITQVIPLKYSDSTQLKTDLQPLINTNADFTSNASSNVLIITDTSANVKRVVKIISSLDTSVADQVDVKVFRLNYADATAGAKLINDVFGNLSDARTQGSPDAQQQGGGGGGGNRGQQQQQGNRRGGKVTASSDTRTNSIVVSGPSDTLKIVTETIKQLDENPAVDQVVYVYRLKNAQALNLEQVMNALFNGTAITNRNSLSNADRLAAALADSSGTFDASTGNSIRTSTAGRTNAGGGGASLAARNLSQQSQRTASELADQVSIIADVDSNSLLLRTSPGNYPRVKQVLDELDRPVQQVLIKVLFAEVTHDNTTDIGAQLSALNLRDNRVAPVDPARTGETPGRPLGSIGASNFALPSAGALNSGLVIQLLEQNFQATIRLLESAGKLEVLSRPYILASDNQLASITVGQRVPVITNSRVTDAGQQINTPSYEKIGILLNVIPHVNPDGVVILDVAPEISSLTGQQINISEGLSLPVFATRSAQSRVGVRGGQTIVIGGLMQDNLTETINKVPLLGDIPFLGELFKRTQRTKTKTELLIFLTPHVAASPDVLDGMSRQETGGLRLVPGAVGPGVYQDHLQGLERGEPPATQRSLEPLVVPPLGSPDLPRRRVD